MKILHIITSMELGGAEKLLSELVPLQRELGHEVEIFQLYNKKDMFKVEGKTSKYNSKKNFLNILEILKEIKSKDYEIIHAHLLHAQFFTAIASFFDFKKNRKYLTTEHSTSNKRREHRIFKYLDRAIFSRYWKVICISQGVKDSLMKWLEKRDEKKFPIISNGVNIERFKLASPLKKFYKEKEDIILVMVARLDRAKDHKTLIEALKKLPKNYKLILAGDGEKREELKILVKKSGVEERVEFLGAFKEVPELLKTCNIAIQSSNFEGFGIAGVEAMGAEIPLVASDVPGLKEVVENGGVLFKKGDSEDLVKKILELENPDYREKIITRQNIKVKEFSLRKTVEKYLKIYSEEKK